MKFSRGFTVIELILFLAISGALFAALMVGVSTNITQQRYRQNIVDLASFIQNQYSEVINTRNERDDTLRCDEGVVSQNTDNGESRGTSTCVILGRAITIENGGTLIKATSVIGKTDNTDTSESSNDIDALTDYNPKLSTFNFSDTSVELDTLTSVKTPDNRESEGAILILRSPSSGLLRVFATDSPLESDLSDTINPNTAKYTLRLCVDGITGGVPKQQVVIDARVSSADGVYIPGDEGSANSCQ